MANETYHQLLQKAHKLSLKQTKEELALSKMDSQSIIYGFQSERIREIKSQINEVLDQIKEMELDFE